MVSKRRTVCAEEEAETDTGKKTSPREREYGMQFTKKKHKIAKHIRAVRSMRDVVRPTRRYVPHPTARPARKLAEGFSFRV